MSLSVCHTRLAGVEVLRGKRIGDARGFLERLFCSEALSDVLQERRIMQINHTHTEGKGTVRGLHFQYPPASEMKFVHCLSGRIFDVAADLRANSSTCGQWHGEILSGDEPKTFVIPEGVAHGFQLLSETCDILYLHTAPYSPEAEGGLNACDERLAIDWPLPIGLRSERDRLLPSLGPEFAKVEL